MSQSLMDRLANEAWGGKQVMTCIIRDLSDVPYWLPTLQVDAPKMKTLEEWEAEKKQKELDRRNKNPQMRSLAENSMKVRASAPSVWTLAIIGEHFQVENWTSQILAGTSGTKFSANVDLVAERLVIEVLMLARTARTNTSILPMTSSPVLGHLSSAFVHPWLIAKHACPLSSRGIYPCQSASIHQGLGSGEPSPGVDAGVSTVESH